MSDEQDSHAWRTLSLLALAELLGMSLWFAASAVVPQLRLLWNLTTSEAAWLTSIVQLGFVAGTACAALLNLADLVPARALFAASAVLGALSNALLLGVAGYRGALVLRFFTGFCLAGVYPPAMKMAATWFRSARGLAIGVIVGALTVGKALPYLVRAVPHVGVRPVILTSSVSALLAAALVTVAYADGPYPFPSRRFSWHHVHDVISVREWRLATASYLGHMFELYAFWTWVPSYIAASLAVSAGRFRSPRFVAMLAFVTIAIGGAGSVWGGIFADTRGREKLVTISLVVSGSCCVLSMLLFGGPLWVMGALAMTWGFFVIADSAQFSTLVTESVPQHAVGTALTVQTSLGFLLTMLPMQLVPFLAQHVGWRWSFGVLALGPVLGVMAIRRFRAVRLRKS